MIEFRLRPTYRPNVTTARAVILIAVFLCSLPQAAFSQERLTSSVIFENGAVNRVRIEKNDRRIVVYGDLSSGFDEAQQPVEIDQLLLTHHRRDVLWAAETAIERAAHVAAPAAERPLIEKPEQFWLDFVDSRFGDMNQQTTKVLTRGLSVTNWVEDGTAIPFEDATIEVMSTPGYTRGAVSYLVEIDDERIAFTGDLLYGDGRILDLYSFQDAIHDARIRGYHGYGSRLAELVASLEKLEKWNPTLIIPSRGPVIRQPVEAIGRLRSRVRQLYANYLSTNALHWYFKVDNMTLCGRRVLGPEADVELMPYSEHVVSPDWVWEFGTARMIISEEGRGFLLDCWNQSVIDAINEMIASGKLEGVDGIFVTHYHDDHTAMVQSAAETFDCPVYALEQYADILQNPGAYRMPALTRNAIDPITIVEDGHTMTWREFELTFEFFPGQTIYHGALLVEHPSDQPILFVGDSFAPSGFDDYCLMNRNLLHEDSGYLLCLQKLRAMGDDFWIVNQHIPYVFRFTDEEMQYLEGRYRDRIDIQRELYPWSDPNFGVDEQWAIFYPHVARVEREQTTELQVRLTNHSSQSQVFEVTINLPNGATADSTATRIEIDGRDSTIVRFTINAPASAGVHVVTADISNAEANLPRWIEAVLVVD